MHRDRRWRREVQPHRHHRLVDDERRVRCGRDVCQRPPRGGVHAAARGVVEIGDHIGEARRRLAKGRLHRVDIPSLRGKADRHRHDMRALQRLDHIMIGGMVDHRPVARSREPLDEQRETLLRAVGDDDLIRAGRTSPPLEMRGDGAAQGRQAQRVIAQVAQKGGQHLHRRLESTPHTGRGGEGGMGPVEQIAAAAHLDIRRDRRDAAGGQAGERARSLPAFQIAFVAQPVEGGRHGRSAEAQRTCQFPLPRQADIQAHAPVQDQHPQCLRQLAIGRLRTVFRAPRAQQPQQRRGPKERYGHRH